MKSNRFQAIGISILVAVFALIAMGQQGCWEDLVKPGPPLPTGSFVTEKAPLILAKANPFKRLQQGDAEYLIGSGDEFTAEQVWRFSGGSILNTKTTATVQMSDWRIFGEKDGILLATGESKGVFKTYDSEGNLLFVGKFTTSDAKPGITPGTLVFANSLLLAGVDHIGKLEGNGTGIYSGKTLNMEVNVFAGLVDGKPTSWVEGTGNIQ